VLIANKDDALVDSERSLPLNDRNSFPRMLLRPGDASPWDGQWMGAFTWRRMDGPWSGLPNGPMLDEHWTGIMPTHVLTGFPRPPSATSLTPAWRSDGSENIMRDCIVFAA
jgi:hypothetical protein